MNFPLLSLIIFLPLAGALVLLALPKASARTLYWGTLLVAAINLVLSLVLLNGFTNVNDVNNTGFKYLEKVEWLKALGMNYQVGADSISAWLIALTAFVSVLAVATSRNVTQRPNLYFAWLLVLETGILGVFASTNLLNFYVFWEVMLIPAYFLIGQWGVTRERVKSAIRFVLYTVAGSLLMLVAMLALAFITVPGGGQPTLDLMELRQRVGSLDASTQNWLFLAFAAAFAVKVPLFPFQAWQPDAYADAPTPVTVMLAGVMSKTGAYGFLRFGVLLFPASATEFAPLMATLALISIIYGAIAALGQRDLKRLLAYSSLSHTGFIILGLFALNEQGISGAVLQMVNHGITTPALFLALAAMTNRTGTTQLPYLGALQNKMPRLGALFLILGLASMGLPGLNQFAGEFLILGGAWEASPIYAAIGVVGVVLAAWYVVRMFQSAWHGPKPANELPMLAEAEDMGMADYAVFVPLVIIIILLGVAPVVVTGSLQNTIRDWLNSVAAVAAGLR